MEKLDKLHQTLISLSQVSQGILQKALAILVDIEDEDNELVENILDETCMSVSEQQVVDEVTKYIEKITEDANRVLSDLDSFTKAVLKGEESLKKLDSNFFQNVWFGDMYDCCKIEGLKALLNDLKQQQINLRESVIIERVSKILSNSNQ